MKRRCKTTLEMSEEDEHHLDEFPNSLKVAVGNPKKYFLYCFNLFSKSGILCSKKFMNGIVFKNDNVFLW